MAIEGTEEILLEFRFRLPPGLPPEAVAQQIARSGASISCGLTQYLKSMHCAVVPVRVSPSDYPS